MVTVGDAQNGKRKTEDTGNPKIFPHTKSFGKYFGGKVAAGLFVIVLGTQLLYTVIDFLCSEPKSNRNDRGNERRNDRRQIY